MTNFTFFNQYYFIILWGVICIGIYPNNFVSRPMRRVLTPCIALAICLLRNDVLAQHGIDFAIKTGLLHQYGEIIFLHFAQYAANSATSALGAPGVQNDDKGFQWRFPPFVCSVLTALPLLFQRIRQACAESPIRDDKQLTKLLHFTGGKHRLGPVVLSEIGKLDERFQKRTLVQCESPQSIAVNRFTAKGAHRLPRYRFP